MQATSAAKSGSDEAVWILQDWSWDPYRLVASPNDSKTLLADTQTRVVSTPVAQTPVFDPSSSGSKSHGMHATQLDTADTNGSKSRPVCQVEGCCADLSGLKEYHQRYKICAHHLKVSSIVEDGKQQRFCQQCGRFHELSAFDGDKRSCRARLQRHNARRRKKGDGDETKYGASKKVLLTKLFGVDSRSPEHGSSDNNQQFPDLSRLRSVAGLRISEWNPHPSPNVTDMSLDQAISELLRDGIGKLAELSAHSPLAQGGFGESKSMSGQGESVGTRDAGEDIEAQLQSKFGLSALSVLDSRKSSVQPAAETRRAGGDEYDFQSLDASLYSAQQALEIAKSLHGVALNGAQPALTADTREMFQQALAENSQKMASKMDTPAAQTAALRALSMPSVSLPFSPSTLDEAVNLLSCNQINPRYHGEDHLARISMKLFNVTPAELHADLKQHIVSLLSCNVNGLEGYMRPGCVFLTLNARLNVQRAAHIREIGIRRAVEQLLSDDDTQGILPSHPNQPVLVQLDDELAWVRDGQVRHVLSLIGSRGAYPLVETVSPICVLSACPEQLTLTGHNMSDESDNVVVRSKGRYLPVKVVSVEEEPVESDDDSSSKGQWKDVLECELEEDLPSSALLHVEILRGGLLSQARTVLALDDLDAVNQICELTQKAAGIHVESFLQDIGYVLECLETKQLIEAIMGDQRARVDFPVREYSAQDLEDVALKACKLVAVSCLRGWDAVVKLLLPAVLLHFRGDTAVNALNAACEKLGSVSMLHTCIFSGNPAVLLAVLSWGRLAGVAFKAGVKSPQSLAPVHLALLLKNQAMSASLTEICGDVYKIWTDAGCEGCATPAEAARSEALTGVADTRCSTSNAHEDHSPSSSSASESPLNGKISPGQSCGELSRATSALSGTCSECDVDVQHSKSFRSPCRPSCCVDSITSDSCKVLGADCDSSRMYAMIHTNGEVDVLLSKLCSSPAIGSFGYCMAAGFLASVGLITLAMRYCLDGDISGCPQVGM